MDLKMVKTDLVTIEDMNFIQELNTYKFSNRVYQTYRHTVKGNFDISYGEAKKKIIRNILCGQELPIKEGLEYKRTFIYGNLLIQLNVAERSICYIKNTKSYINGNKRNVLSEIMGIEDDK